MKTQAKRGYRPAKPSRAGKAVKSGQSSLRARPQRVSGPRKGQPAAPKARPGSLSNSKKTKVKQEVGRNVAKPLKRTAGPVKAVPRPRAGPPGMPQGKQQQFYEEAVRLFHAHAFDRADSLFQKAMQGPNRTLAHHAQVHSQICQKRLRPPEVTLKTVDDHYNYAVTLINARRLKEAAEILERALRMAPQVDYIHYALAAAQALQGNPQGAYERLKTAIELQPRNRILARGDADFAGILEYPPLASLLQIELRSSLRAP